MMRVGLIDVDGGGRFPNIVLMKIAAWHKAQGLDIRLMTEEKARMLSQIKMREVHFA